LTITYNLLGFCLASLIYGPLSEIYGRRTIMLIGNAILMIGAIGCVMAPTIGFLLGSRFIQGIGAATSAVVVSAIIADVYAADKAASLYGLMNAVFSSLMALAPVMGGFINRTVGWRGNYGSVALICLISWFLLFFFLPETNKNRKPLNVNKILIDYKTLLTSPLFLAASAVPSLLYGCYMTFVAIIPFLYMQTFKLDIFAYTIHQGIIVAAFALSSAFLGKIIKLLGRKKSLYIGLSLSVIAAALMLTASSPYWMTATMSLFCIGSAILQPIIFAQSIESFPTIKGTASSAIMSMRYLLCSGLTGVGSYFYNGTPLTLSVVIFVTMIMITGLIVSLLRINRFK
jgi:DHA1 family bicyclomycin/chloramphenicol resistance-like MFS transporter